MRAVAIIPAAGRGTRMRSGRPKALRPVRGRPLLAWTLEPILDINRFSEILIACPPGGKDSIDQLVKQDFPDESRLRLIDGGQTRQESVFNCLKEISAVCDLVAIHDGARPLATRKLIMDVLARAHETGAAIAAVPCKDSVKMCNKEGVVTETLERAGLMLVQTPQCFRRELIVAAHAKAERDGYLATDDSALVERMGVVVHTVMGSYENIKVTTLEDIILCEEILRRRRL
jgi:2-C-methyl-D-erythritol 4-phosphate cytidylyltransferase